jgi:hypothetical protein
MGYLSQAKNNLPIIGISWVSHPQPVTGPGASQKDKSTSIIEARASHLLKSFNNSFSQATDRPYMDLWKILEAQL